MKARCVHRLGFAAVGLSVLMATVLPARGAAPDAVPGEGSNTVVGLVFRPDRITPAVRAVVSAYHLETGKVFSSVPTKGAGGYTLTGLPDGFYDMAIEADGSFYAVQDMLEIRGGGPRSIKLALGSGKEEVPEGRRHAIDRILGRPARLAAVIRSEGVPERGKRRRAAAIGLGAGAGALLLSGILGDDDPPASPTAP
ncbi:MAG: carboxypeptidase regulatory-like domain-containing protein [Acidobacteria bacterium]|nr:carboxypeptidase regulatory-like domain-containing protein [Acidobacteriota bacterium]